MTPREVTRAAERAAQVTGGTAVDRIGAPGSTRTHPPVPAVICARLGAGIRLEQAELTPALLALLKACGVDAQPAVYQRQRRRISTRGVPRFPHSFDETLNGGLILPRGLRETVSVLAEQTGSALEVIDDRSQGTAQDFMFSATLSVGQREVASELAHYDLAILVAPPGSGKTASSPRGTFSQAELTAGRMLTRSITRLDAGT